MERGGMTPEELRERVAQRIDKALDGDCGYGVGEHLADALAPIFAEVRAQALRGAADRIANMVPYGMDLLPDGREDKQAAAYVEGVHTAYDALRAEADRIEKEATNV